MIATKSGYVVINDSTDVASHDQVFFLNSKCKVTDTAAYTGKGSRDPEDLALSPDGNTLWVGDIGDNPDSAQHRTSVVLWSLPVNGSGKPVLHRLAYPDAKPRDAEALLIGADGKPYIITKMAVSGKWEIYRPTAALPKDNAVGLPMEKAGDVPALPKSNTENRLGVLGRQMITGAARSPDGTRVALRTYADAFEWDVPGGDIVKALTTGKPRMTPLADEFGESIAYTPDGKNFLTVSDIGLLEDAPPVVIQSYVPATQVAADAAAAGGSSSGAQATTDKSWTAKLTLQDITYLIGAVGVVGVVLVGLGVFGILRARRKRGGAPGDLVGPNDDGDGPKIGRQAAGNGSLESPAPPVRGTTYGGSGGWGTEPAVGPGNGYPPARPAGAFEPAARPAGGVYGGQPAAGAVYGGGRPSTGGGPVDSGAVPGGAVPSGGVPGPVYGGGRAGYPNGDERGSGDERRKGQSANGYGDPRGGQYGRGRPGRDGGYPDNGYPESGYR